MRQFLRHHRAAGAYSRIDPGARLGRNIKVGSWSEIGKGAVIGDGVAFGSWSCVGPDARVEDGVELGSWVKIGAGAVIGAGSVLPYHVRVQPGVVIPPGTVFKGHELVTPRGVIAKRNWATVISTYGEGCPEIIKTPWGKFAIPLHVDGVQIREDYHWGLSDELEYYRVTGQPVFLPCLDDEDTDPEEVSLETGF